MKTIEIILEGKVPDSLAKKLLEKGIFIKPAEFVVGITKENYSKTVLFKPVGAKIKEGR